MSRPSCQVPSGTAFGRRVIPTGRNPTFVYARMAATLSAAGSISMRW